MLGLCDAYGKFIVVDIGAPGRRSDGGIFRESEFGKKLFSKQINLPEPCKLGESGPTVPYFIVGDEAFPLTEFLLKPFPRRVKLSTRQKIYNYRICRGRRMIECAFGMLAQRFRIFRKPILARLSTVKQIVQAAVVLHNFIIEIQRPNVNDENLMDQLAWNSITNNLQRNSTENCDLVLKKAIEIRKSLCEYFMYEGSVHWQWSKVRNLDY